ncbi:MAG: phage tail protein, partial [Nitrospirae bacterium]
GILSWLSDGVAHIRIRTADGQDRGPTTLDSARFPYSLAWIDDRRIAVLMPDLSEALSYDIAEHDTLDTLPITGDIYPLRAHNGGPFLHTLGQPPYYPTIQGSAPLYPISLPHFSSHGLAEHWVSTPSGNALESWTPLDSGDSATEWHRLYIEASIPEHCGAIIWLATTNEAIPPPSEGWHEHRIGQGIPQPPSTDTVPRGVWLPQASEIPFHSGLLSCAPETGQAGLFTVLIQRSGVRVRALKGRYLWMRVELFGDGRTTPSLAAIRAYGSRFSYVDQYLPELYRETVYPPDADAPGTATPADFLERFTLNFEGLLTMLEDRIAQAHILTHPNTTPDESLPWLGSWIGTTFHPAWSFEQRRRWLQHAPQLYETRGTLNGLRWSLELISGGGITRGDIVVVELFRLRRTFSTILGADLADEHDPLLAGLVVSGNAYVGDTLFLGADDQREFLALFDLADAHDAQDEAAVRHVLENLAFRVTVLVREGIDPDIFGLIRDVAVAEAPAHVHVNVATASQGLLVGIEAMIGVETFIGTVPPIDPVKLDKSYVGYRDVLRGSGSVDPRVEGGEASWDTSQRPVARLQAPPTVPHGGSFTLDAAGSEAGPGHRLARFIWELKS